ncbi:MAG: PspC domain-containing protein [Streptosporangiales bacterium]|nr:PspC domain-containing protein [Streptosporangiales bacterium]
MAFRRSRDHKLLGGVCGGLAQTLNLDVALVRVLAVVLAVVTNGIGALAYLAAWLIIPEEGSDTTPLAGWLRR